MDDYDQPSVAFADLRQRWQEAGLRFLRTEVDLGLTLISMADGASDNPERQQQLCTDAHKAYDSFLHFMPRFEFSEAHRSDLIPKLHRLRSELLRHGIPLDG